LEVRSLVFKANAQARAEPVPIYIAFISCFFFGITCVQLYLYTQRFPQDTVWNKALVWWCWAIDAIQTAFACHVVYFYTV
jgi:hypothetical protein